MLIIAADQGRATPPARARNIQKRNDGSKLVVIEGSGHMTTAEKPAEVNRALEDFYASLSPTGR